MTTPFDTTRLDKKCRRIAAELNHIWSRTTALDVEFILTKAPAREGYNPMLVRDVLDRCRRPKMVPA